MICVAVRGVLLDADEFPISYSRYENYIFENYIFADARTLFSQAADEMKRAYRRAWLYIYPFDI